MSTKREIVSSIAKSRKQDRLVVSRIIDDFIQRIKYECIKNGHFTIHKFGRFEIKKPTNRPGFGRKKFVSHHKIKFRSSQYFQSVMDERLGTVNIVKVNNKKK